MTARDMNDAAMNLKVLRDSTDNFRGRGGQDVALQWECPGVQRPDMLTRPRLHSV